MSTTNIDTHAAFRKNSSRRSFKNKKNTVELRKSVINKPEVKVADDRSQVHRCIEFKKSMDSTCVVLRNDKKYKLTHYNRLAHLHDMTYKAIKEGISALGIFVEVCDDCLKQGRDDDLGSLSSELKIRKYKNHILTKIEELEVPERCVANLSDVDFNEITVQSSRLFFSQESSSSEEQTMCDDHSVGSCDRKFSILKEKFKVLEEDKEYHAEIEGALARLSLYNDNLEDGNDSRTQEEDDEVTLSTELSLNTLCANDEESNPSFNTIG